MRFVQLAAVTLVLAPGLSAAQQAPPAGSEFQVNTYTTDDQIVPAVAPDGAGGFVVIWQSYGSSGTDTDSYSVQGQRYFGPGIFEDGFESGDTAAWSNTVP